MLNELAKNNSNKEQICHFESDIACRQTDLSDEKSLK